MHESSPSARLGTTMRRLRHTHRLSQEALAERAGLDRTFISLIERGKRRATLESAEAIAAALGLTLVELIQEMEAE